MASNRVAVDGGTGSSDDVVEPVFVPVVPVPEVELVPEPEVEVMPVPELVPEPEGVPEVTEVLAAGVVSAEVTAGEPPQAMRVVRHVISAARTQTRSNAPPWGAGGG